MASKQEIIIIEVQYGREYDYMQRILYGVSKAVCEHIVKGEAYEKISKVISVNILHFDLGHGDDYVYHGTTNYHALDEKLAVINLSLGGYAFSHALQDVIRFANYEGVPVIAAAGNDGFSNKPFYPAAYANVIAVAASDKNNNVIKQSNRGDYVDITAPGEQLLLPNGKTTTGTSAATALVTGAVAQLQSQNLQDAL
ncbi:MAG: S8 family serine peptidase [Mariprofundales bacterium]